MTVLGLIGFFAFSFTMAGGIVGGTIGIALGNYAGRKLKRKIRSKTKLTEFEIFLIKLGTFLKWAELNQKKAKYNLN